MRRWYKSVENTEGYRELGKQRSILQRKAMENQSDLNPERETLINTFCEITSSTNPEALFYLESHNFDLDSAVSTYFETNPPVSSADIPAPSVGAVSAAAANAQSPADSQSYSPSQSESSSPSRSRSPSPRRRSKQPQPSGAYNLRSSKPGKASAPGGSGAGRRSGGIHTFADLNRRTPAGSGSDSDEPQEYYTGGEKRYFLFVYLLIVLFYCSKKYLFLSI